MLDGLVELYAGGTVTEIEAEKTSRIVMLFGGVGDQILWLSLLPEFRRRCGGRVMLLANKGGSREIAGFFEGRAFDWVEEFDTPPNIQMPPTTSHFQPLRMIRASHIFFDERERYQLIGRFGIGITDLLRIVLDLPVDSLMAEPEVPLRSQLAAAERMRDMELPIGRTVLLSPWAHSWRCRLPDEWWGDAVRHLTGKGYTVVTNVANRGRSIDLRGSMELDSIPGTIPVDIPISEVIPFAEYCGHFFGMRSGLCDLLARTQIKKLVVYPHGEGIGHYLTGLPFDVACRFWSLRHAFQRSDILEEKIDSAKPFDPGLLAKWLDE